jgi:nickel/cobalt exporter
MWRCRHFWCIFIAVCGTGSAIAHPILDDNHHRTITVNLWSNVFRGSKVFVLVDYRLEMDERVAQLEAFGLLRNRPELLRTADPRTSLFTEWGNLLGPRLARGLELTVDRESVPLVFESVQFRFSDEQGKDLQHLRCDFRFKGEFNIEDDAWHDLHLHEGNYGRDSAWPNDRGALKLDIERERYVNISDVKKAQEADPEAIADLTDEKYASLRDISARLHVAQWVVEDEDSGPVADVPPATAGKGNRTLVSLLLDSREGFVMLCILAFGLGAVHALQPGHGKTLVAAYLVGERGTVWHACLLGVTTTLTHTGAVLVLAAILAVAPLPFSHRQLETTLGMIMGLLIAALGAWLLLRRLSGRADHFHFGGHGHDHTHRPHDHHHGHDHDHVHANHTPAAGWIGLILLGVQGGLVPCWDAVVMLLFAIGANLMRQALPLLLCFSAGLALVLVVLGIAVVHAKGIVGVRWGETRLFRALPYLSAVAITLIGLGLCYQSVHH